jgi:hypothetical protein
VQDGAKLTLDATTLISKTLDSPCSRTGPEIEHRTRILETLGADWSHQKSQRPRLRRSCTMAISCHVTRTNRHNATVQKALGIVMQSRAFVGIGAAESGWPCRSLGRWTYLSYVVHNVHYMLSDATTPRWLHVCACEYNECATVTSGWVRNIPWGYSTCPDYCMPCIQASRGDCPGHGGV